MCQLTYILVHYKQCSQSAGNIMHAPIMPANIYPSPLQVVQPISWEYYCYALQPSVNPHHWMTDHPRSDTDLTVNHRPYPSVADLHTWASDPVPTFLGLAPVLS